MTNTPRSLNAPVEAVQVRSLADDSASDDIFRNEWPGCEIAGAISMTRQQTETTKTAIRFMPGTFRWDRPPESIFFERQYPCATAM